MATDKKISASITSDERKNIIKAKIDKLFDAPDKKLKAFASVVIGDFAVHGIRVFENDKGIFVSMPSMSHKNSDGTVSYDEVFHPVTLEARKALGESVVIAYKSELEHTNKNENTAVTEESGQTMQHI